MITLCYINNSQKRPKEIIEREQKEFPPSICREYILFGRFFFFGREGLLKFKCL